jgi:hypothetical protein
VRSNGISHGRLRKKLDERTQGVAVYEKKAVLFRRKAPPFGEFHSVE